jgi:hypothetical protein
LLGPKNNKHRASIKSDAALQFERNWALLMPQPKETYLGDVALWCIIYYPNRQRDLDVALLQDQLQTKKVKGFIVRRGIIQNDRQVKEIHARHEIDAARPRILWKLTEPMSDFMSFFNAESM